VSPQNFIKNLTRLFELRVAMQMIINATEEKRDGIQLEKISSTDETKYKILYKDGLIGTITLGRDGSLSMQIDAPFKVAVKLRNQLKALVEEALKVAKNNKHPDMHRKPKS